MTKSKTRSKRSIKNSILAIALIACLAIGGGMASAYFTDGDTITNEFTVGQISIDLTRPSWVAENADKVTPLLELADDPTVTNDGVNDAFVFVELEVPVANIKTAALDGTPAASAAYTQLFTYGVDGSDAEGFASGFELLGAYVKNATSHEFGSMIPVADIANGKSLTAAQLDGAEAVKYVYSYSTSGALTPLAASADTGALYDWVKFTNAIEDQGLELQNLDIVANAYGIQTLNVLESGSYDGSNADGSAAPVAVWEVVRNANPALS